MSVEAITWALKQPLPNSSAKFVLTVIANCADGKEFLAFPSIAYIAEATSQDPKTVKVNLKRLKEYGLIEDSGQRCGSTGQVIVYRINVGKNGPVKEVQKRTTSKNGPGPKVAAKESENGAKEVQKRQVTGPKTDHGNVSKRKETSENRQTHSESTSVDNSEPKASALGARLPKDWVLSRSLGIWAAQEQPTWTPEHIRKVAAAFKDYWIAKPGKDGRKLDWDATWRNWVRNEKPLGGAQSTGVAAVAPGEWWKSAAATEAQGRTVGVEQRKGEPGPEFLVRVAAASGRGPWIDAVLHDARKFGDRRYQQIVAFFSESDLLPPDFYV